MAGDRDERARRIDASARLVERAKEFSKVKYDARMGVLHDELMDAIDTLIEDKGGRTPFNPAQIAILKDVSFQLLYLLHPDGHKKPNILKRCWMQYAALEPLQKFATTFFVISAIVGSPFAVWKGYKELREYYYPEKQIMIPAPSPTTHAPATWPPVQLPPSLQPVTPGGTPPAAK